MIRKKKIPKYQKEYSLVEGYPFVKVESAVYKQFVFLKDNKFRFWDTLGLNYPTIFEELTKDAPRYELLLRRIDRVKKKKRKKTKTDKRQMW